MGQAIAVSGDGKYLGACFIPNQPAGKFESPTIPPSAAFWRRSFLLNRRDQLDHPYWTNRLVDALEGRSISLDRTFAVVDNQDGPAQSSVPACLGPAVQPIANSSTRSLVATVKNSVWAYCAKRLAPFKRVLRELAGLLPRSIESRMRRFYLRRVQPYVCER